MALHGFVHCFLGPIGTLGSGRSGRQARVLVGDFGHSAQAASDTGVTGPAYGSVRHGSWRTGGFEAFLAGSTMQQ